MIESLHKIVAEQGLVLAFALVGILMWLSAVICRRLTAGRIHASAIAIVAALALAWLGGVLTGGKKGLADVPAFAGLALLGGPMLSKRCGNAETFTWRAITVRFAGS